jgi:excisionase family DNA binding protein
MSASGNDGPAERTAPLVRLTAADVMTGREVAILLHAPVSTVEDWARRNIIPSVKIGRRRLYIASKMSSPAADQRAERPIWYPRVVPTNRALGGDLDGRRVNPL